MNFYPTEILRQQEQNGDIKSDNITVLMYHQISENKAICRKYWTCLHVDIFHKHLKLLEQLGYTPITFKDYQLVLSGELALPRRPVIITFDDGYEHVYNLAYPLLQKYGMAAVVFSIGNRRLETNEWDQSEGIPTFRLLKDNQLRELQANGFEIGAHSMDHSDLTTIPDSALRQEIHGAKYYLEDVLQSPVISISYPYGLVNSPIKALVRSAGFQFGCAVSTPHPSHLSDHYEIGRSTILNSTGPLALGIRLLRAYTYYEWARHRLSRVRGYRWRRKRKALRESARIKQDEITTREAVT